MSTRVRQAFQSAAGAAGGGGLNVEDVFSTYLYNGTNAAQTITNGIDLSTEGGLVWMKARSGTGNHLLYDTERGPYKSVRTNQTNAENTASTGYGLEAFNTDGFDLGLDWGGENWATDIASWTFRKAPKFFDVVTYTGNGTAGREISHNLGTTVGTIIVKRLNAGTNWGIYHRSNTSSPEGQVLEFDTGATTSNTTIWNNTAPTSTVFTVGNSPYSNFNGSTYVAYLFAHNDGDGEFGPTGDQDIIKCGSYTGNGSSTGPEIDLGFEPQFVIVKRTDTGGYDWVIQDTMRGMLASGGGAYLKANASTAEYATGYIGPQPTGFRLTDNSSQVNASGGTYIYIAIRRGPMAVPESATEVFAVKDRYSESSLPTWQGGFVTDMALRKRTSGSDTYVFDRLRQGKELAANATSIEATTGNTNFDYMNGFGDIASASSGDYGWMWRRAPNFFDVVCYTGNGTAGRTVSHNLGVAPEMIWIKSRTDTTFWPVYHKDVGYSSVLRLDSTSTPITAGMVTNTSDTTFTLSTSAAVNSSGHNFIAYLFASLDGVSKVGSYTGTGAAGNQIDCGFTNGARFVLIKGTDTTFAWVLLDTERGIVSGNDKALFLNSSVAEVTADYADPYSAGFELSSSNIAVNGSGYNYIFYAIA